MSSGFGGDQSGGKDSAGWSRGQGKSTRAKILEYDEEFPSLDGASGWTPLIRDPDAEEMGPEDKYVDDYDDDVDWSAGEKPARPRPPRIKDEFADPTLNYYLDIGEELMECPYYGHKVLTQKFLNHLMKCKHNYDEARRLNPRLREILPCTYNWLHHVPRDMMKEHEEICPDAKLVREYVHPSAVRCGGKSRQHGDERPTGPPSEAGSSRSEAPSRSSRSYRSSGNTVITNTDESTLFGSDISYFSTNPPSERRSRGARMNPDEEDWELDAPVPGIALVSDSNFRQKTQIHYLTSIPPGLPPAKRKEYRRKQNQMYQQCEPFAYKPGEMLPPHPDFPPL